MTTQSGISTLINQGDKDFPIWTCGYSAPPDMQIVPLEQFLIESPVDKLMGKSPTKMSELEEHEAQAYLNYVLDPKVRAKVRLMRDIEFWAKKKDIDFYTLLYYLTRKELSRTIMSPAVSAAKSLFGSRLDVLI